MWKPVDRPWQFDLLDRLPPSVDSTLLDEALALTPTERVEKVMALMRLVEELRRARSGR